MAREYHITWSIDLTAYSAVEACEQALAVIREPSNLTTVFCATPNEDGEDTALRVDLADVAKPEFAYTVHADEHGPVAFGHKYPWTYYDEDGSAWWMSHHCATCARSAGEEFVIVEGGYRTQED
jgi:hypothetical protein